MAKQYFEDLCALYKNKIQKPQILSEASIKPEKAMKDSFPYTMKEVKTGKEFNDAGPEAAEGFDVRAAKVSGSVKKSKKKLKNTVKSNSSKLSNHNMKENTNINKKSIFDKLYEDVMSNEIAPQDDLGIDDTSSDLDASDDLPDTDESAESPDLATAIEEIITKLQDLRASLGGATDTDEVSDVDDIEDIEDADELAGGDVTQESHADLKKAPDSITKLAGQNNKVGNLTPSGGKADASISGADDGGKGKPASDGSKSLMGKNNKVGGKITGGNKPLFKV